MIKNSPIYRIYETEMFYPYDNLQSAYENNVDIKVNVRDVISLLMKWTTY